MIRFSVFYPAGHGATFDHDYYRDSHVPLAAKTWGVEHYEIDRGRRRPVVAAVHLRSSCSSDEAALAMEGSAAVHADVANYTNITPVAQTNRDRLVTAGVVIFEASPTVTGAVPLRWIARSSVPRYEAMTSGSLRTSSGVPSLITRPGLEAVHAVADPHDERHVVLDHEQARVELRRGCAASSGPNASLSRCAMPAVGSSRHSTRWRPTP